MLVRVYQLKQIANETLKRTTGRQDSGLDLEDANKRLLWEPPLLLKAMNNFTTGFNMFNLYSLKVFS